MTSKRRWFKDIDELMVLACLSQKPCYCYEIVQFINSYRDDDCKISPNGVYTALYFLKDRKAIDEQTVEVSKGKEKVYYNILPAGKKYYEKFLKDYRAYINSAEKVLEDSGRLKYANITLND